MAGLAVVGHVVAVPRTAGLVTALLVALVANGGRVDVHPSRVTSAEPTACGRARSRRHGTPRASIAFDRLLTAPDHWLVFADRYLTALDGLADGAGDGAAERRRRRPASRAGEHRARALAEWHGLLLERLAGSDDGEALLDRLVAHPALGGPDLTFVQARLADRRGETERARTLAETCRKALPGDRELADFAARVGAE